MRRGLGPGRVIVGVGAVLAIIGAFLPWSYAGGGDGALPRVTSNAFDGPGVAMFVAAVALLGLLILPYATSSGRSTLDRWLSYVILGGIMVVATVLQVIQLLPGGALKLTPPLDVLGLYLGVIGTLLVAWGVAEIVNEEARTRAAGGPRHMTTFRPPRRK
jgi:quinol-cytochrome oxidoreductase complex cytochrome b subunit